MTEKKIGEGSRPPRVKNPSSRLELETYSKAGVERTLVARVDGNTIALGLEEVRVRHAEGGLSQLVDAKLGAIVRKVEQISSQADLRPLSQPDRVVSVEIHLTPVLGASQRAAS